MIAEIKGTNAAVAPVSGTSTLARPTLQTSSSTSVSFTPLNDGDLNIDPFHLTVQEATLLSSFVNDPELEKDIQEAMWAGDNTVPIHPKHSAIWTDIRAGIKKR